MDFAIDSNGLPSGGNAFSLNPCRKKLSQSFYRPKTKIPCIAPSYDNPFLRHFPVFPLVALAIVKMKPRLPIYGLSLLMRSIDFRFAVHQQNSRFAFFQCGAKGIVGVLAAAASHDSRHAAPKTGLLEKLVESRLHSVLRMFVSPPLRHIISCLPPRSSNSPRIHNSPSLYFSSQGSSSSALKRRIREPASSLSQTTTDSGRSLNASTSVSEWVVTISWQRSEASSTDRQAWEEHPGAIPFQALRCKPKAADSDDIGRQAGKDTGAFRPTNVSQAR